MIFYVLEKERGAAGFWCRVPPRFAWRDSRGGCPHMVCGGAYAFADAVGDFCDFQDGVDFGLDAFEFAGAVEGGDPLAEVVQEYRDSGVSGKRARRPGLD